MLSDLFFSLLKINVMATIVAVIVLALKNLLKKIDQIKEQTKKNEALLEEMEQILTEIEQ